MTSPVIQDEKRDSAELFTRNAEGLLTTEVDGELLGLSVEEGMCYGFNGVATRIWALLAEPCSIDDICSQLVSEFKVAEGQYRQEVTEYLDFLIHEKLVVSVSQ